MSVIELNDPSVCNSIDPQFNNITVRGTATCAALTVGGVDVNAKGVQLPGGAIQTGSPVTINNSTWTQLTTSAPLLMTMVGTQLQLDLQGYIVVFPASLDVIDMYATYTKNGGVPVPLTPGSQISNACSNGCSCRIYGTTVDSFAQGDSITLQINAKCQVAETLDVGTNTVSWQGMFMYV